MSKEKEIKKKEKMKTWKKVLLIILISLLGLALAAGISMYALFLHYYNLTTYRPLEETEETFDSIADETDHPAVPTDPGTTGGTDTPFTGSLTDPGLTSPPHVDTPTSEIQSIESHIDNNTEKGEIMQFDKNITNILLVGTDGRTVTERGRSDSMILLSINKNTHQIVMTSILRDIYLHIPGLSLNNRINAAYSSGGISRLLDTIEENFRIHIDKYVRINFFGFEKVIDRLGGLDIRLSQAEINFVGMQNVATPGIVHMNGAQVLRFCRCRYVNRDGFGSDFARAYRQREVMTLIAQKLKGSSFSTLNELLEEFLPQVVHNLEQGEIMDFLFNFNTYMDYEIKSYQIPVMGYWKYATIRRMDVTVVTNYDKTIEMLEKYIKGTA